MARSSFRSRARLHEAIALSDTGDPRSFNDIYGEEGISGGEDTVPEAKELGPEEITQLRTLAQQILDILGPDPLAGDDMTGDGDTEALAGDEAFGEE